jgi:5-methylcytosine-specific restriction endonuclease McrA
MKEYYRHFVWGFARAWCIERQEGLCANCHCYFGDELEVHHIVPLNGGVRWLTPYNLPWNLIGFCHQDHLAVAAAMVPPKNSTVLDSWEHADFIGQSVMRELGQLEEVSH